MRAGLFQAIYQERRRLYFVTMLAFLSGVFFYARLDVEIAGLPGPFVVGLIYATIIGTTATLICIFMPAFRFMLEAIAVSRLTVAFLAFSAPGVGDVIISSPILNACIVVGFGVGVSRLMHGRISKGKRLGLRDRLNRYADEGRSAARVTGHDWQRNYVAWMDDAVPATA